MEPNDAAHLCTCRNCGVINEEAMDMLIAKHEALQDAERELRGKRSQIRRLRGETEQQREFSPQRDSAMEVFNYWRSRVAPDAREFSGKRFDAVVARLNAGYSVDELKRAVDGLAAFPYVTSNGRSATGEDRERQDELELVCRNEANLRRFTGYAKGQKDDEKGDVIPRSRIAGMQRLIENTRLLTRLNELRGWTPQAVMELGLGLDDDRVVFFYESPKGAVTGVNRYQPNPERRNGQPKGIAFGIRDLFPRPEDFDTTTCWLVEGEPDAVAIASAGLPGVAIPGVKTWKEGWADRFGHFSKVYICFDCDKDGREAALIRKEQLAAVTEVFVVDLDPARRDGYDVNDLLIERGADHLAPALASLATVSAGTASWQPTLDRTPPMEKVIAALRRMDLKVTTPGPGRAVSQCPNHDDRHPSFSITEGSDGRVLLHCHAGCETDEIVAALGLELRDLFAR